MARSATWRIAVRLMRAVPAWSLIGVVMGTANAAPCTADDDTRVTGIGECLLMRRFGPEKPEAMVVYLHWDTSAGGPANYHFPIAQRASSSTILAVALVRPGYPDGSGNTSSGEAYGRSDNYTKDNIAEVGAAVERLRQRFKPGKVIVVGHSGGAAIAAVLLGMQPKLADGTVLVACPCDIWLWRAGTRPWTRSENPMSWIDKVDPSTHPVAITGTKDGNTSQELAQKFVNALKMRGVDAVFVSAPDATHNNAFTSRQVAEAVGKQLGR
jgi:pimeloyl-ACP methyl ester carboxylesterase